MEIECADDDKEMEFIINGYENDFVLPELF